MNLISDDIYIYIYIYIKSEEKHIYLKYKYFSPFQNLLVYLLFFESFFD